MTRPLRITVALAIVAAVVAANVVRRHAPVKGVDVYIDYNGCDTLETAGRVIAAVTQQIPALSAMRVKDVDTKTVAAVVARSPYLTRERVTVSLGGHLVVHARQRRPVLRVYCAGECFYVDESGVTMPLSPVGSCDITIANGHFKQKLADGHGSVDLAGWLADSARSHYTLAQLWKLADFLHRNDDALARYDQIFITPKGDFCLVPDWAGFTVVLGTTERLDEKMRHLQRFAERVLPVKGDTYTEVSLKYNRQIVCRKRQ
ncbi:MAG: cell division protein FtsQ [bacterium P3]|nr:MAG: cell division protein FtsQ [bacterium P3]KWW40512.1 MAG: cell division protein FtsQ [bacterium F083]